MGTYDRAELFTDDAVYVEHQIEDDQIAFYVWNNLPDPTGGDQTYGFEST